MSTASPFISLGCPDEKGDGGVVLNQFRHCGLSLIYDHILSLIYDHILSLIYDHILCLIYISSYSSYSYFRHSVQCKVVHLIEIAVIVVHTRQYSTVHSVQYWLFGLKFISQCVSDTLFLV